ncbi:ABC transporter ATP-binding protein [Rhodopila sp.]|jgi:iron(III) transport system ATP-binding protein|uniref:ABC transporter ATP-binding protein n=1 Tax=Rhodopila sp. TaxID=2480087 RepID=UPI002C8D2410|nr:ABC transporter ATP-binding protein [Rhodopila sp.]HVZ10072.1 ABC transporter ATP-binding protein [Rhodopila sp.]
MSRLELLSVTKRYGTHAAVDALDLAVESGHLVSLLGPSGCGKTTTLRLVSGFAVPDGGSISVAGQLVSSARGVVPPERREMSMIFQSYALWPHLTVAENVAYGLKLRRLPREDVARRVRAMLETMQLTRFEQRYPAELSGGQQQRVGLARALVVEPKILLLDEPLSNLDASLREEMRHEIRRLHDRFHYTTIYVTHDQAEAMTTSDLIAVMRDGRIEQAGGPEDIYERPETEFVARFIGSTNILRGRRTGEWEASCDGLSLTCGGGAFPADGGAIVSIRPHHVILGPPDGDGAAGCVERAVYLGAQRHYIVALDAGPRLQVLAPAAVKAQAGERVNVILRAEHCRALTG